MKRRLLAVLGVLAIAAVATAAFQLPKPQVFDRESGLRKIELIKNDEVLYNMQWSSERVQEGGATYVVLKGKGDNDKQDNTRIEWTEESRLLETATGFRPVSYQKHSTGAEQMDWSLGYNWDQHTVLYRFEDRAATKVEIKNIDLPDDALPGDDALYVFLRSFPFEKGTGFEMKGKVIMTDGSVIEGRIIHRGDEKLKVPFGEFDTYMLELKPTGLIGMLPTRMFMWFDKNPPHACLRFDGMEGIARTKNVMYEYETSGELH